MQKINKKERKHKINFVFLQKYIEENAYNKAQRNKLLICCFLIFFKFCFSEITKPEPGTQFEESPSIAVKLQEQCFKLKPSVTVEILTKPQTKNSTNNYL